MQITIHRALAIAKKNNDKLTDMLTNTARYIGTTIPGRGDKATCNGMTIEAAKSEFKSNYDKFMACYENLVDIRCKIARSNAGIAPDTTNVHTTQVTLAEGKKIDATVSDIIILNKNLCYMKDFVALLARQYNRAKDEVERFNRNVDCRLDELYTKAGGSKENAPEGLVDAESYHKMNDYALVDPLNLAENIAKLQNRCEQLEVEYDAALSTLNATTIIEVAD